jgi:hypothetical protein
MSLLTEKEQVAIQALVTAWNAFCELEQIHTPDTVAFARQIDACHSIIMSRPVMRELNLQVKCPNATNPNPAQ